MSVEIESEDVIRLILQFFKENGFQDSFATLQDETSVRLNTVDSREAFIDDIVQGRWEVVLKNTMELNIAPRKLMDLYEQVVIELCEMGELNAARTLLRQTEPMFILKQRHPERYLRLEHLLSRLVFDAREVYTGGMTKEKKRNIIAQALASEVIAAPRGRLITLLEDAVKWQQHQGLLPADATLDLFKSSASTQKAGSDAIASSVYCTIKFPGKKTYAESAIFSPNGQYLVTGSVDGFIEIWNYINGKLRKDLKYQAEENLMAMDDSVICLQFSRDSELLVSGSTDGKIAVWKVQSGICQRRISPAHSQGVTSVCFNRDGSQVLSGSYDHIVKIHNIRSGKLLKEFHGHTSFVNAVLFSNDNEKVMSTSSDGTLKIWETESGSCLHTITLDVAGQGLVSIPKSIDRAVLCTKSRKLDVVTMQGKLIRSYLSSSKDNPSDFVAATVSPQGELIYGITEDSMLLCFSAATGNVVHEQKLCDRELIGVVSHPFSNVIAAYDDNGHVYLLKSQ